MTDIVLDRRYEDFIKRQLDDGRFDTASEVVQTALDMLEDFENVQKHWLREEIPARLAEIEADPSIGLPIDEVFSKLEATHRSRMVRTRE